MTRFIAPLQQPLLRHAAAATLQRDPPTRGAEAGQAVRRPARRGGDAPAGHRGARLLPVFAHAQHQAGDAAGAGGELQPAPGGKIERARLAQHGARAARAQPLLHRPQDVVGFARPHDDQPVGIEPEDAEAGTVEIAAREAPERRPAAVDQPRGQGGREALGSGIAATGDLVQRAARQAAPGQRAVERGDPQRHRLDHTRRAGRAELERAHAAPQGIESGAGGGRGHRRRVLSRLIMFVICSRTKIKQESSPTGRCFG